jgi:serine/threonine-protein kinase
MTTGAASRTLTAVRARRTRGAWLGGGVLLAVLGVAGTLWWMRRHVPAEATAALVAEPPPGRGAVAIASEPAGATIFLNGEQRPETTPATLGKLALGTPYEIRLSRDGFQDATQSLTLTEQDPSSAVSVVMLRSDGAPATPPAAAARPPDHKMGSSRGAAAQPSPPPPAPAVASGTGKLNVGARGGWCAVVVDGQSRGPTPVAGVTLSAGPHSVTCTPEGGRTQSATVRVDADGTTRFTFTIPQ